MARKLSKKKSDAKYYRIHKKEIIRKNKIYYETHKKRIKKRLTKYRKTTKGKAVILASRKRYDKLYPDRYKVWLRKKKGITPKSKCVNGCKVPWQILQESHLSKKKKKKKNRDGDYVP